MGRCSNLSKQQRSLALDLLAQSARSMGDDAAAGRQQGLAEALRRIETLEAEKRAAVLERQLDRMKAALEAEVRGCKPNPILLVRGLAGGSNPKRRSHNQGSSRLTQLSQGLSRLLKSS